MVSRDVLMQVFHPGEDPIKLGVDIIDRRVAWHFQREFTPIGDVFECFWDVGVGLCSILVNITDDCFGINLYGA
jgi:hypothetical protein